MSALTIGSLFSGYGGLDMGIELALGPARTAWVSDVDPGANRILAHRYPDTPNLGDITTVNWTQVEPVDVITGGYPCQPFSQAGARLGTEDRRHLWPYVANAIGYLRPPMVVFENVRGHLTLGFDQVLADLAMLGYDVTWVLLKASDIGACHNRARLFIIGRDKRGRLRGGADRRGGLHRDHPHEALRHVQRPGASGDGHEGLAHPSQDDGALRRSDQQQATGDGGQCSEGCLAAERSGGSRLPCASGAAADPEARPGAGWHGSVVSDPCQPRRTWPKALDFRASSPRTSPDAQGAGGQPARPTRGCDPTATRGTSGSSVGRMVAAGGRPVRAGAVPWASAYIRDNGGRGADRAADVGACHGRFRVFVVAWPAADTEGVLGWISDRDYGPAADADVLGSERGRRARDGWTGPADSGRGPVTLLPTPAVNDMGAGKTVDAWDAWTSAMQARHGNGNGHGASLSIEALRLLPTPLTTDASIGPVPTDVTTPLAGGSSPPNGGRGEGCGYGCSAWGTYAPAVHRWEIHLGRLAPSPTEPSGKNGTHRLSERAVEFMMGLPDGWVTDVPGVTRNEALKALGNGVVPAQAAEAVRWVLANARAERAA